MFEPRMEQTVAKKIKAATAQTAEGGKPAKRGLSRKVKIMAGGALAFALVSAAGGTYLLTQASSHAPGRTAEAESPANEGIPVPMPVVSVASAAQAKPSDYQIVQIFKGEALLATRDNLVRVKVGSSAPGIGTVTDIQTGTNGGGAVIGTDATLRSL